MKHAFITLLVCFIAVTTRAQLNPYALTAQQADSLQAVQAQTSNDSVKMELNAIFSIYYSENNRDSAIYFLNRQLELATKLNIPLWKSEALSYLGLLYKYAGNYSKSLQSLSAALEIANNEASEKNVFRPKLITGVPAWFSSRQCLLSIIYSNMALLYDATGDNDKAVSAYQEAIRIAEKNSDRESLWNYYEQLSVNYWNNNKSDSAFILLRKALDISRTVKWKYYTGIIYLVFGQVYRVAGDTAAALSYLKQSVVISHQQQNFAQEGICYKSLSRYFLDRHQPDSVILYIRKAEVLFREVKNEDQVGVAYLFLSSAYQLKGNMDSAYTYLLLSKNINDSMVDVDRTQNRQYQIMNFNEQRHRQEAESERNQKQSRMITYATLAGLLVTFLILFLLYRNNRQKQKTNTALAAISSLQDKKITQLDEAVTKRTEQLNTFRQAMATDFHDQTGNMLSAITSQASLLKLKLNGNGEVLPIVESIITNSNELYDSSKDFLWNLNHNSDDPLEVFHYLTGYGQVFYNQFRIPFSSTVKGEVQNGQQLEPFAALNLIYIFKEAMTNVVKHAEAAEVVFEMEYVAGKVLYSLHDDGRWKPKDETTSHYGLSNIERRCEKNNFGFLLSRQDEGTQIEITAPVKIDFIS